MHLFGDKQDEMEKGTAPKLSTVRYLWEYFISHLLVLLAVFIFFNN